MNLSTPFFKMCQNCYYRNNEQGSGGSPLGFKEIFNELSLQEGLHSLDDILSVIIDPEGMSFNDLKPIYKEFLLKLSLTLTKDELFQRSRMIMRKQKKKILSRNNNLSPKRKPHVTVGGKFRRLKHMFKRNLKTKLERKFGTLSKKGTPEISTRINSKVTDSSISTSSYDTRPFRPRKDINTHKKQSYKKRNDEMRKHGKDRISTSEESDFFSLKRNKAKHQAFSLLQNQNRNSSSGYVSCSECSYDSDTCTCISADKCYCSLGQKHLVKSPRCHNSCKIEEVACCCQDVTFCECDTDSCAESNKCYCQNGLNNTKILERARPGGYVDNKHKKLCKRSSNTKSTKSLEYIMNPSEGYYEKLKNRSKYGTQKSLPIISSDKITLDYERLSVASIRDLQLSSSRSRNGTANSAEPSRPVTVQSYGTTTSKHSGKFIKN